MGRGRSFRHKAKGHPGEFPEGTLVQEKEPGEPIKDVADFATYEAYKNSRDENKGDD